MARSRKDAALALAAVAHEQGGYFTTKQAKQAGYGYKHLDYQGLSHGASSIADSCFRNSSGVSLRNSQKLKSGSFRPSRSYGV